MNNFDAQKAFINDKREIPFGKAEPLERVFKLMNQKWSKEIFSQMGLMKQKNLRIGGGNYTFFFVLPYLLKKMIRIHPFVGITITLLEAREVDDLEKYDMDIIFTGAYSGQKPKKFPSNYMVLRKRYKDGPYMAISKELFEQYNFDKDKALQDAPLLFARIYKSIDMKEEASHLYPIAPINRRDECPKLAVDLQLMGFYFMQQSFGIWHTFSKERKKFALLYSKPMINIGRYVVDRSGNGEYVKICNKHLGEYMGGEI